jgi:DNA-binding IclR family transcriptional regulator
MDPRELAAVARAIVAHPTTTLDYITHTTTLDTHTVKNALAELTRRGALTQHGDTYTTHTMALWSIVECARIS